MPPDLPKTIVLCNGASHPNQGEAIGSESVRILQYLPNAGPDQNINLELPNFVRNVFYLPDRFLDLLELATYVYSADRLIRRGRIDAVEYQSWARSIQLVVRVRDYEFWLRPSVSELLSNALEFVTGDREYSFLFQAGHSTPPTSLFDSQQFHLDANTGLSVLLFSGGLDSLAGALDRLELTDERVCLVSHQSQPGTARTQNQLADALSSRYPGRTEHYRFICNLKGTRASEETQRTRSFLYNTVAFAIAQTFSQERFYVFENGITSINFPRRENLSNARATRTAQPQTIRRLQDFFSEVAESPITIETPFLWKTKTDIIELIYGGPYPDLIPSSVSCSKTFQNLGQATHCGGCSQCVDRRFASYAAKADDRDQAGLYAIDIITRRINEGEVKTTAVDYLRQAREFAQCSLDHFQMENLSELTRLVDFLPGNLNENYAVDKIWNLCRRHGQQVLMALHRMRNIHDDPFQPLEDESLLRIVNNREFFRNPVERLVVSIRSIVSTAVPHMFRRNKPADEPDLNEKIGALLETHHSDLISEHPAVSFACARVVPDFEVKDLLIESKYIRGSTSPSRASEGIAADLTKYPSQSHILFLVYDPDHAIINDQIFVNDFESKGRCTVCVLR